MDNTYVEFIKHVMRGDMLWSCFTTIHAHTFSAINVESRLLVTFRCMHPERTRRKVGFNVLFDPTVHEYWYEIAVQDPAFRWGRRRIFNMKCEKTSPFFELLEEYYKDLMSKAHLVSKELRFHPEASAVRSALEFFSDSGKKKATIK